MKLLDYDVYTSITRVLDPSASLVFIDVGANQGATAARMLREFPNATVYAFEPSPSVVDDLNAAARAHPGLRPVPLAAGSANGEIDFNVTRNHWCSSVLTPSPLGKRYYGDWYDTVRTVRVGVVRLDDWTAEQAITRVDFLKVDAQGYDLEVLRGAEGLLRSGHVKAVACEFQFAAEYEGCATFSQIDTFLCSCGYAFHQLHESSVKGGEDQTSYGDGLWLRTEVLHDLRAKASARDTTPAGRVRRALLECQQRGLTRVALFGAGQHTRDVLPKLAPATVTFIIDDNPALRGTTLCGAPVQNARDAIQARPDAVILSSDSQESKLWAASRELRDAGVIVLPLYGRYSDAA